MRFGAAATSILVGRDCGLRCRSLQNGHSRRRLAIRTLISQIEGSLGAGFYFLSLFAALAIPDIAGALDSENGVATRQKYAEWYETWVRPRFAENELAMLPKRARQYIDVKDLENPLTGDACYYFRCSMLHQGSPRPKDPFPRIMFIEPGSTRNVIHYGRSEDALIIDLNHFCREVISGALLWLDKVENSTRFSQITSDSRVGTQTVWRLISAECR